MSKLDFDVIDAQKTLGALTIVGIALENPALPLATLNLEGRTRIGAGWTFMTCMQWLTGKKAWAAIEMLSESGAMTAEAKAKILILIKFAAEFCQHTGSSASVDDTLSRLRSKHRQQMKA
jgi:hypothetical protein